MVHVRWLPSQLMPERLSEEISHHRALELFHVLEDDNGTGF